MKAWFDIHDVYHLIGIVVMLLVGMTLRDRANPKRYTTALFWFLFGASFLFGDLLLSWLGKPQAYRLVGVAVIVIALLAGTGRLALGSYRPSSEQQRLESARRLGNRIFLPALLIPLLTVACTLLLKGVRLGDSYLLDQKHLTLACWRRPAWRHACWAGADRRHAAAGGARIPALGGHHRLGRHPAADAGDVGRVFVAAKTGLAVQQVVSLFVDPGNRLLLVVIYCVGMALFTMVMGNAFAAFPVMTAGIALPFLIVGQHAAAAPLVAIGMYSGYCGTLMTPMAANFNIVPAALLELKDKYLVIKTQLPTALLLLAANILLMYFIVFR